MGCMRVPPASAPHRDLHTAVDQARGGGCALPRHILANLRGSNQQGQGVESHRLLHGTSCMLGMYAMQYPGSAASQSV